MEKEEKEEDNNKVAAQVKQMGRKQTSNMADVQISLANKI